MYDIKKATFGRLPIYLKYLTSLDDSVVYVSSSTIAKALGLGDVQVKKDLGSISGKGKPKLGYEKVTLISDLKEFITKNNQTKVVLARRYLITTGFISLGYQSLLRLIAT